MNNKFTISGFVAVLLGVSGSVLAAGPSPWDSISVSLVLSGDLEAGASQDLSGYRFDFTQSLGDMAFVQGAANVYAADGPSADRDFSAHQIGVGARYPISAGAILIDLWGTINYERVSLAGTAGKGPGIDVGVRAQPARQFDLNLALKIYGDMDFKSFEADFTGYEISAAYRINSELSLLLSYNDYELDPDGAGGNFEWSGIISLGVRFHF